MTEGATSRAASDEERERAPHVGMWGWAIAFLGLIGGLIGYFSVKSKDEARANHIMKWSLIWTAVSAALWIGFVIAVAALLVGSTSSSSPAALSTSPIASTPSGTRSAQGQLDGTYTLTSGDTDNFVGYRVNEKLVADTVESTATGRTDQVTGSITISGSTVNAVTVTADLSSLQSDNAFRDTAVQGALTTGSTSTATFTTSRPIELGSLPAPGQTISETAIGTLTLRGKSRSVSVPVQARWDGTKVQVVGSMPVRFADYGISVPSASQVASVDDQGTLEFQLFFSAPR